MNRIFILTTVLVFANINSSSGEENSSHKETVSLWNRVKVPQRSSVLLIALEEAEFARKDFGDWLPIKVLEVKSPWIDCKIDTLKRQNNRVEISFQIRNDEGVIKTFTDSFYNVGEDGVISGVFQYEDSNKISLSIPCSHLILDTGKRVPSIRRLMFNFADSVEEFEKTVRPSSAMPGFKWKTAKIEKF